MKRLSLVVTIAFVAALALSAPSFAQQAPAGSTGLCKDGTYTNTDKKRGACSGHGGVKDWYGAAGAAAKSEAKSAKSESKSAKSEAKSEARSEKMPTANTAPATGMPATNTQKTASTSQKMPKGMRAEAAPGGGAGKVWVNSSTHVYHCSGDEWYGKTKAGEYMSESEAKAKGARAARGKGCA